MPTTLGTGRTLPTTTTRTTATLLCHSSRIAQQKEHVTIEEVFDAYFDCRKHKRNKRSAVEYEINYELNNYRLWEELNDMTYKPTTSIAFCVTKPKLREVFAADFRDRIIHHLFIGKINDKVENMLSDSCCACRTGKGSLYAARRLKDMLDKVGVEAQQTGGGWYARCDIRGFFMSINKDILHRLVNDVVCSTIKEDLGWWLWLSDVLIWHRPEQDCEKRGNVNLWSGLPDNKTLFKTNGTGVPIGNLTSQVLANLYLAEFDRAMIEFLGNEYRYIRYADDFIIVHPDRRKVLDTIGFARDWLKEHRKLSLHEKKVVIQKAQRGVRFVGYFIKGGVTHCGRTVRTNALKVCREWSTQNQHTDAERSRLMTRYNSYSGLVKYTASYMIRRKMWRLLREYKNLTNINSSKIKVRYEKIHQDNRPNGRVRRSKKNRQQVVSTS